MNTEDLIIRPYREGDEQGILELLNAVFAEDDPAYEPRSMAAWRWEYAENPAGKEVVVAQEPSGRIVAHYACIPYKVIIQGETSRCGQGVDSMVHQDYRRGLQNKGLFLRTSEFFFQCYGQPAVNAYGFGFPNKKAFRLGVRKLGYQPIHAPLLTLGRNLFESPAESLPAELPPPCPGLEQMEEIFSMDERVEQLWQRLAPEFSMGIIRDASYLNWRYLRCPLGQYRAFALVKDGKIQGMYICRENWTGPPILALSEFLVPAADTETLAVLLTHACSHARSQNQQRVELWLPPNSAQFTAVLNEGFRSEESPFNLCIKIYGAQRLDPQWVRDHWCFSIGDADVF